MPSMNYFTQIGFPIAGWTYIMFFFKGKDIVGMDSENQALNEKFKSEKQKYQNIIDKHTTGCELVFNDGLTSSARKTFAQCRISIPLITLFNNDEIFELIKGTDLVKESIVEYNKFRNDFHLYHEIGHIQHHHTLINVSYVFICTAILYHIKDWKTLVLYGGLMGAALIPLMWYQEYQADIRACELMGSAKEGIYDFQHLKVFLNKYDKKKWYKIDYAHPPIDMRIKYMQYWERKHNK